MQQVEEAPILPIIRVENIPDELKQLQQWCMWKSVTKEGKEKPSKEPFFSPSQYAKTNDPSTWLKFEEAIRMLQGGLFDGIGFIFTEQDNFIGIDIDNCIGSNGFSSLASELIELFDSYTELSQSGRGLHIIVKASDEFKFEARKDSESGIECYQKLRYFTFSGNVISENYTIIEHRENEVTKLLEEYLHPSSSEEYENIPIEVVKTYTSNLGDQQVLERLFSSQKKFGDTGLTFGQYNRFLFENGHQSGDCSSDDWYFAKQLAYECNGEIEQMNRLFNQSALWREKWDKKHYSNGDTYGERTLYKAVCVKKSEIEKRKQQMNEIANSNEQTLLPKGYMVKGEALFSVTEKLVSGEIKLIEQMICRQAPYISRSFSDVETGNLFYEVAWTDNNNQQTTIVPASGIATKKELVALSNRSLAVTENNAKQLITYFDLYNMVNKRQREYLVSRIGHIKGKFIHPSIVDDVTIMPGDIGEKQLLESIHAKGGTDEWLKNILEPIKSFPKALLMVLASFASVLLKDLKLDPFIIDFAGETSNGKTTLLKACASVWGTHHFMSEWNITPVSLERKTVFLNSLPILLDDSRKITNEKQIKNFIYNFSGGRSKGRGSISGSQQEYTWNNILISTGEASLNAYAEQMGGVAARIISIEGIPFPNVEPSFFANLHNNIDVYYGAIGIEFIRNWLEQREKLIPKFDTFVEMCQKKAEGNPVVARVARNYAALIYTGNLLNTFFKTDIDPMVLYKIFVELVSENKALDKPKQLLELLLQELDSNRSSIFYKHEPVTIRAIYKDGFLLLSPSFLKEFLGVEEKSIRATWLKREYTIGKNEKGKIVDYHAKKVSGKTYRVIQINPDIIKELGFDFSQQLPN